MEKTPTRIIRPDQSTVKRSKLNLLTFFLALSLFQLQANDRSSEVPLNLHMKNVTVEQVFKKIESLTTYRFLYESGITSLDQKVTLKIENGDITDVLNTVFKNTKLSYAIQGRQIIVNIAANPPTAKKAMPKEDIESEQNQISGVVSDNNGMPLPGANVVEKGTSNGTQTDFDGKFSLTVAPGAVLAVTYLGFKPLEVPVNDQSNLTITMVEDSEQLSEVVVVAYGEQNRETLTSNVSSVKAEEIENLPVASSDQLLQGRAPGVFVSTNSGDPGGGVFVRVRGSSSISGSSDPLYVVDGIPIQSGNLSQNDVGGATVSPIADINPADIESIDILKDASATAIYGSRAANGVVLITTKKGTRDKAVVSIGVYGGVQSYVKKPSLVTGQQFETLMNESARNNGRPEPYADPANAVNTNWNDLVVNDGAPIRNIDLSVKGGGEKARYFVSANNYSQEGLIKNSGFERFSGRVNMDFRVNSKLNMGTSMLYSRSNRDIVPNSDNIAGAFAGSHFYPSNMEVLDADGNYNRIPTIDHPLATINDVDIQMETGRFLGTVFAEYTFLPGLRLKSSFSADYTNNRETEYLNTNTNAGSAVQGSADLYTLDDYNWIQENVLSYQFNLEKNAFNILVGNSVQKSIRRYGFSSGTGFPTNDFRQISSAAILDASSGSTSYGLASIFSRVNYNFDQKYLVTLNLRGDASSRFGKDNRWGIFPAVGLGWVISKEKFLQDVKFLNNLKFMVGYGITGNQSGITDFNSVGLWEGAAYTSEPGVRPLQLENPSLKWETTKQTDISMDMTMFDNRVNFTAGYYYKKTEDLLLEVPVPTTSGFESVIQNSGAIQNQGVEIGLGVEVFPTDNDLTWYINGNISGNRNKILDLAAPFNVYNRDLFRYEEGAPMYSYYMHKQLGVDPQTGDAIFEDYDGDGEFSTSSDRYIVGDANPDFFGGLTNTLKYKGIDLSFFWQFSYGNEQLNFTRFFMEHGGSRGTNYTTSQLARWQQPGDITDVPRMSAANYASDLRPSRFVEDGSYLRLKNISLGYTLPSSITESLKMSTARVYVSGQNIVTITNYSGLDPEVTATADTSLTQGVEFFTTPSPMTIMAGINLSF